MSNPSREALEQELRAWPGVEYHVEPNKVHPKLRVNYRGSERFLPFSKTNVDPRGVKNKISQLRRMLRELGAQRS